MAVARLFTLWFVALAAFFSVFGFSQQFLRAESAVFMQIAQGGDLKPFLVKAYNGHFTPVAFLIEYLSSVSFGHHAGLWFVRQTAVIALFSAVLSKAISEVNHNKYASSAIVSVLSFNPVVASIQGWPFLWMQMASLTCAAASSIFIVRFGRNGDTRSAWLAVLSGYASMHFFGVGLAYSITAISLTALVAYARNDLSKVWRPLAVGFVLTVGHAVMMVVGSSGGEGIRVVDAATRFFALLIEQPLASMRAFVSWISSPSLSSLYSQAVGGIILTGLIGAYLFEYWRSKTDLVSPRLVIATFAIISFYAATALSAYRLKSEVGGEVLLPFLIGDRYLIFPMFSAIIIAGAAIRIDRVTSTALIVVSVAYSAVFLQFSAPRVWPDKFLSHESFWHQISADPNIPSYEWKRRTEFAIDRCSLSDGSFVGC